MNTLTTLIDSLLVEWASPRVRRTVHGLISIALLVATVWIAAEGDWRVALATLLASVYTEANRANTHPDSAKEGNPEIGGYDGPLPTETFHGGSVSGNDESL